MAPAEKRWRGPEFILSFTFTLYAERENSFSFNIVISFKMTNNVLNLVHSSFCMSHHIVFYFRESLDFMYDS